MNGNYLQLIIFAIVVGSGAIRWIYQRLQEQAAIKKAQEARERARLEALRTGRGGPPDDDKADEATEQASREQAVRDRLEELAERRRRQIEAMRRQQGTSTSSPSTSAPTAPPRATTSGTTVPSPPPPLARPGPQQAPRPQRPARQQTTPQQAPRPTLVRPVDRRRTTPAPTPRPVQRPAAGPPATRPRTPVGRPAMPASVEPLGSGKIGRPTIAELRRAVILREVLDPPIALREPGTTGL